MQLKLFTTIAALATLAVAVPAPSTSAAAGSTTKTSKCDTGPIQCCQTVQKASEAPASTILGLLGIVIQDLNIPVGLTCSPISVVGVGGTSCAAQPVCCKNNNFNGVIALGCTPINIGL